MPAVLVSSAEAADPERLLEALLPDIRHAVSTACYHYSVSQSEIEDFYHQVTLLLMEDDYSRLRSFAGKSSPTTWFTAVAMHCVSNYVRSQKRAISLDEIPSGSIVCEPTQVDRLIALKRRGSLGCAVRKLTARERQLFQLLCRDEVTAGEVAKEMGIKVESVHRRKHALIKKLQEIIDSPVGPKKRRRPKNK